ncbi:hypothetical protein DSO57_1014326 [Entomophthora muscae]|uniref:Uncharacterized protein n=1 Tax=Entomophthora muscae TaxID=34485 RepID=A0ACC2SIH9_9FUNG|nr:hypothetical protein DSO57_1014326 [Entomophthora muscae]
MSLDKNIQTFLQEQIECTTQAIDAVECFEANFNSFCDKSQSVAGSGLTPLAAQDSFDKALEALETFEAALYGYGLSSLTFPLLNPILEQGGSSNDLGLLVTTLDNRIGQARIVRSKLSDVHKKKLQGSRAALDAFSKSYATRPSQEADSSPNEVSNLAVLLSTVDTNSNQDSDDSL